ncbi:FmdE family protein [Pectinatus brassicae]|uniref:Formylmethanofuran dehydrogenase subunit E n=1 Tax=Pectinatus brassicae TaxID=862415 RepID=A0A840UUX4_9FIRM|nr:FmdE family protein [Pectinatus brassicae]MBB5336614.1 formylmethanofuran dehydrogenase subunit E [Pectinatus brassicae]
MINAKEFLQLGLEFHGHKCPAMPLGLRAGAAAMNQLNVIRSKDKELFLIAETGNDHAAGCFVDGLMTITGCTYGKSNIKKSYYGKMAFTLVDTENEKAVRIQLKPDFFEKMLQSPFVQQRKQGILPQNIPSNIIDPLLSGVMNRSEDDFLLISPIFNYPFKKKKGNFDTEICEMCGERVFSHKLQNINGKKICIPCAEKSK